LIAHLFRFLSTTRRGRIIDGSSYSLFSFQGTMSFSSCLVPTRFKRFVFVSLTISRGDKK